MAAVRVASDAGGDGEGVGGALHSGLAWWESGVGERESTRPEDRADRTVFEPVQAAARVIDVTATARARPDLTAAGRSRPPSPCRSRLPPKSPSRAMRPRASP